MILGGDTVTILRGRTRDNWGSLSGADAATVVMGCSFQPLGGLEQTARGEMVVANASLFAPGGTDIIVTDRVQFGGLTYVVNGPPKNWTVLGSEHVEAELKLVEGQG